MKLICLAVTLLLPLTLGLTLQEDDLVFDDVTEETSSTPTAVNDQKEPDVKPRKNKKYRRIERFWGVPDSIATAGHIFKLKIPKQAFSGNIERYEIREINNKGLPHWLFFDEAASTILGVPAKKDEGQHRIHVKAYGKHGGVAEDTFTIRVSKEIYRENRNRNGQNCDESEDQTVMTILLDGKFDSLKPTIKVEALENLAGFLGLQSSALSMRPQNSKEENTPDESTVVLTGPGSVKRRKSKHSTCIQWQVGCDGHLWKRQADILSEIHEQARDGTLSEVMQIPVLFWRVKTETSDLLRNRRETGSGDWANNDNDNDNDYDDNYDDQYDSYDDGDNERDNIDDNEAITELPPKSFVPSASEPKGLDEPIETEHPHRHHHGQGTVDWKQVEENIDEDDIVPIVNRPLEAIGNTSASSAPRLKKTKEKEKEKYDSQLLTISQTTTEQTSATQNSSSPTPSTTLTTQKLSATTIDDLQQKTSTITTTGASIATVTTELPSTSDESLTELIQETSTVVNTIKNELESGVPTVPLDNDTLSTDFSNITIDEIIEPTEAQTTYKSLTQSSFTSPSSVITESPTTEATPSTTISTTIPTTTAKSTTEETTTPTTPSTTTTTSTSATTTTTATPSTTASSTAPWTTTLSPETPRPSTEKSDYGVKNFPPRQDRRLKKIPVTAGKPLSYIIPANTFSDIEDGDTRSLQLSLLLKGHPVKSTHWLQLNKNTQEVYGLPLENDVSQWEYDIVASDSEGLSVTDSLDIYVQQHKFTRSVNHEFSIYLKIEKFSAFPTNIDWELRVIQRISEFYGDPDPSYITVRSIDIENDQAIFTWTNDTVPRTSECPKSAINKLFEVLIANKDGEPNSIFANALGPEIRVKRVVAQGLGQCENMNQPETPRVPVEEPKSNVPPLPRNQVDHINATVGQLLVFRVPEDTFYDPEDGSARNMRMSLLTIDRTPIPSTEWLQFDSKNQEFYGVPLKEDLRNPRREYQLVVTDREGASATDGLVVVIHPAPRIHYSVEFSMTLDTNYESFAYSAIKKRNFIEKLRDLFGDRDTSTIALDSISEGSTVVTWRNSTLPTDYCPNDEIKRLKEVLVKHEKSLSEKVNEIMGKEFPVQQITLIPMGVCAGELTNVLTPDNNIPPSGDSTSLGAAQDDYLITFILPAIIIAAMVLLAGVIAFILYRRRRSGKMSVSEHDDERQSFRSKGIPVIFQDELEEKPDPGNKSPVILKEEKPPLPPPEYQKSDDGADQPMLSAENSEEPYQPPPPFARTSDNNRQNRPKPTPTYRKPPPYVPP